MDEADVGYQNCGLPILAGAYPGNWLATFARDLSPLALRKTHVESTCNPSTSCHEDGSNRLSLDILQLPTRLDHVTTLQPTTEIFIILEHEISHSAKNVSL
jgi:hypothetical protein